MTKSIRKIEKALAKLEVLGSRLSCLFLVAFVFVCVFVALFLVAKVSDFAGSGEALDVSYLMQLTLSLLDFAIYGVDGICSRHFDIVRFCVSCECWWVSYRTCFG